MLGGPLVAPSTDQLLLGEGSRSARQARRSSPTAVAERGAARSKFEGLSPARAASEAKSAFPALIEQTAGGVPVLAHNERIVRYPSNHAAEISLANGAKGVIESTAPIAVTSGHRHLPLDLRLTEAGSGFRPLRSTFQLNVPKNLANGVSLPALGVSLTPVDRRGAPLAGSQGALQGAAVLWRHADRAGAEDLASVAKATSEGFDLSTMLLSQRSPGKLYFRVGTPAGARLKSEADGSVQILKGKTPLATIAPVSAEDAEGSSVPVSSSLHGHTLELSVEKSGDYLYPIAVDPELTPLTDPQLVETAAGKKSNWEFKSSSAHFEKHLEVGVERLETKGVSAYEPGEFAVWAYRTQGVSHIYEIKTKTSAKNKLAKIESYLEFQESGGTKETKKTLSTEFENTEYENKSTPLCAANASKVEECAVTSGKPGNAVVFEQAATAKPGANYAFTDSMSEGLVSIAEPSGTHSTTSYNTSSSLIEVEIENEAKEKVKVKRTNVLHSPVSWLSRLGGEAGGALEMKAKDTGIGVSRTKFEYESSPGAWTQLEEHNYLTEKKCAGVQCYVEHPETWTLPTSLPDGEQKLRYRAEEAISGTQSLEGEGQTTVKVDTKAPHALQIEGLPYGDELSERKYQLTGEATDGEGSTVASSGIKSITLYVDGSKFGVAGGSCTVAKGECTASEKWTVNGAELGAGKHDIKIVALDNAGNEATHYEQITIRHSTPVALGPGSVDLQSGDFALGAGDVSMGSGLSVARSYSSRATTIGANGPLGPEWSLSLGNTESLSELVDGSVVLTGGNGSRTIFVGLGEGKFESPTGDSNLELSLEENKETKQKLAYYLKNAAAHTSVKFAQPTGTPAGSTKWVPVTQEGALATDTVTYSYSTSEPATSEYSVPGAGSGTSLEGITAGPDGNMWFAQRFGSKIGKITPTGSVTTYPIGSETLPEQITTGSDGNLWFSESKKIGKITPAGKITQYKTAWPEGGAVGITMGSDGYLWYSEPGNNDIDKMNIATGETWTAVHLPTGSEPSQLALGPDGNIWFVDGGSFSTQHKIGKVVSGVVTEYTLPEGSKPHDITAGPAGTMWFTNVGTKKVGKIKTSGEPEITEYALGGGTPFDITEGPENDLWFTTGSGRGVDRITPSGEVSSHWVSSFPGGIAPGPDGNLWFGGSMNSWTGTLEVGSMTPPGTIAEPTEVRAPVPAGVSCSWTEKPTEMNPGCRALELEYSGVTNATGEGRSEWGRFAGRLEGVSLVAYSPSAKKMEETEVAHYEYDKLGRLRAEYDPRISPNLKSTYGYDEEGHVTALAPPGQEPWTFTYGAIAGDAGTGRLLKAARAPASSELWNGEAPANTEAPKITGAAREGVKLAVSSGKWSPAPNTYAYQWTRCTAAGACSPIAGATNANYTPLAADVGDTLLASVRATSAAGSLRADSAATAAVQTLASGLSEYSLPANSGPKGITPGPEAGTLWFTNFTSNKVGKSTSSGTITEYALPASSGPEGIVKGPDGNLWVAEFTSSKIAKVTPSGTITEYALPASTGPRSIVAGPDGNLWFTEYKKNKVAKITTSGTITEYTLPTNSKPVGIVSGPDGNLWFTESETHKVAKITTSGTITEYAVSSGGYPWGITAGSDGNLWYVDHVEQRVGKVSTSGTITEYALPATGEYITSAAEALWVTNTASSMIYRVTTAGVSSEYPLPSGSQPRQLAVNSLGEFWLAQFNDKLAKFTSSNLAPGETKAPEPGITLAYGVPVGGGPEGLRNLSESQTARWGQVDNPVEGTAIFPPDQPRGWPALSYNRATVYYLDEHGRQVNVLSPSTASSGSVSTTEYNEYNDVIRTLSPENRRTALAAGSKTLSAEKSKLLDTQSTYNGEGAKEGEVQEPGTRLIESFGPQHMVKYLEGHEQKEMLGRDHKQFTYDQGAPGGETYDLVTESHDKVYLANTEDREVRTSKTSYSGQSNLGWELRAPTTVSTIDPEGNTLTTLTTEYNPTTAQITEVRGTAADKTLSYATKFGETGTEAGKLKNPWGVAVDSEGKLLVVDSANNRIEKFSAAGAYVSSFGEAGSGNGQLKEPEGIALDASGHIWVADTGNNRIEEFSSAGAFMAIVGSLGTESGKFKAPAALAFDTKGNMWVADTGNSRVEKFDKEAKYASEFGSLGTEAGKLKEPKGIAVDSGEHVWVADTGNNRIQEFSTTGSLLKRFGTAGAGEGQLNTPIDLKIDSSGNIWTVDSLNSRAESFTPSGAYVTQIGFKGTEAGQLTEPRSLAFDATGKAWISDSSNNRLEQWSKGPNAHDQKTIYYSSAANGEYPSCGGHPEWAGLVCETLPAKQPELMGLPKLPVTSYTYNMFNEPETISETFGATTRTKKETYDSAGRRKSSETTASTGTSLPKVNFSYSSELGVLEKESTEGEEKTLASEFNRLGQMIKYTDSDGNSAKYKYAGPENDYMLEEASDSSASGTSKQTYEYDATTKLRTKLIDSAAGSFTASYDAEGRLTSVSYPYSLCANYAYDSVGQATSVQYLKTSNCSESEPGIYYSDSSLASVRGEMFSQTSTLAGESYFYDASGHLSETQETPAGEGCTVRAYAYDEEGNRASSSTRAPGGGGACQSEGGTIEAHNYDEAGRLADGGMAYDGLGNVTKLPAADAEGKELTSTFYVDNAIATQTQGGVTNEYKLDPEGRVRETTTGSVKTKSHYDGPGETVAWTENAEQWVRNIGGIDGALLATQTNGATPVLQLHDLQGNVVATIGDKAGETKLLSSYNSTEFGVPNAGKAPPKFAWLGAAGVESTFTTGVITYGATSYVPQTARTLQSEAVSAPGVGGGSGSGAAYTMQAEPWVMQGAARSAAEAPGLEAAREQAAMEAAMNAAIDPEESDVFSLGEARLKGEHFLAIGSAAEVINALGSIPEKLVDKIAGLIWDKFTVDFALDWFHKAGAKLVLCSYQYYRGIRKCKFTYDEIFIGVHLPQPIGDVGVHLINLYSPPEVQKCFWALVWIGKRPLVCVSLKTPVNL
ncbi:MAG: hypothetical protein ACHQHO_02220 [Solirubrobacterales bacterium]